MTILVLFLAAALLLLLAIVAGSIWLVVLTVRYRKSKPMPGRPRRSSGDW